MTIIILTFSWAYWFAVQFLAFFSSSQKIAILLFSVFLFSAIIFLFKQHWGAHRISSLIFRVLLTTGVISFSALVGFAQFPAIFTTHTLTVELLDGQAEVVRLAIPDRYGWTEISPDEYGGNVLPLHYEKSFIGGGIDLYLRSDQDGKVKVTWDKHVQEVSVSNAGEVIHLSASSWGKPRWYWGLMGIGYWIALVTVCLSAPFGLYYLLVLDRGRILLCSIGLAMIVINLIGLVIPPRSAQVKTLPAADFYAVANQPVSEPIEYATNLAHAVHESLTPLWDQLNPEQYKLWVPVYENWILHTVGYWNKYYERYEYANPHRNLARGVGICSTASIVMEGILEENGIPSQIVALDGHVVVQAELGGQTWILDPNTDVVVPHGIHEIENNLDLLQPYYGDIGTLLIQTFAPENVIHEDTSSYFGAKYVRFEQMSYILIWIIPMIFCLPYIFRGRKAGTIEFEM